MMPKSLRKIMPTAFSLEQTTFSIHYRPPRHDRRRLCKGQYWRIQHFRIRDVEQEHGEIQRIRVQNTTLV